VPGNGNKEGFKDDGAGRMAEHGPMGLYGLTGSTMNGMLESQADSVGAPTGEWHVMSHACSPWHCYGLKPGAEER